MKEEREVVEKMCVAGRSRTNNGLLNPGLSELNPNAIPRPRRTTECEYDRTYQVLADKCNSHSEYIVRPLQVAYLRLFTTLGMLYIGLSIYRWPNFFVSSPVTKQLPTPLCYDKLETSRGSGRHWLGLVYSNQLLLLFFLKAS